ncbi:MAG: Ldh family oxidoreductase [Pseudoxanthomonas sp.]
MDQQAALTYSHVALIAYADALLQRAGMPADKAEVVARILVDADLMGHSTHGLNLLKSYLDGIADGAMRLEGDFTVVAKRPATQTWDGHRLPGAWLVSQALQTAIAQAQTYGTGTVVIRNSHHIGCLAAYLRHATEAGMVLLLFSSAPAASTVAPFGGTRALFSPSPLAMGCPTQGDPIWVDISTSITTNNMVARLQREGGKLPQPWLLDHQGNPTDDPNAIGGPTPGSLLPLGGLDAGHKGYGLALMVEALTAGLSDQGRFQDNGKMSNTVFLQVLDPEAFGGLPGLQSQMQQIAQACVDNPPRPGVGRVRVPGQKAAARYREQAEHGVQLTPDILRNLQDWSEKLGVAMPSPLSS